LVLLLTAAVSGAASDAMDTPLTDRPGDPLRGRANDHLTAQRWPVGVDRQA